MSFRVCEGGEPIRFPSVIGCKIYFSMNGEFKEPGIQIDEEVLPLLRTAKGFERAFQNQKFTLIRNSRNRTRWSLTVGEL